MSLLGITKVHTREAVEELYYLGVQIIQAVAAGAFGAQGPAP